MEKLVVTPRDLVSCVERLLQGDWETEEEMNELFAFVDARVPCPFTEIQGVIYHSPDGTTPQQMVDAMLAYESIEL